VGVSSFETCSGQADVFSEPDPEDTLPKSAVALT